jgi:hypothetical protein
MLILCSTAHLRIKLYTTSRNQSNCYRTSLRRNTKENHTQTQRPSNNDLGAGTRNMNPHVMFLHHEYGVFDRLRDLVVRIPAC